MSYDREGMTALLRDVRRAIGADGKDKVLSDAVAQAAKRAYWPRTGEAYRQAVRNETQRGER